jgi:hypothetical protein
MKVTITTTEVNMINTAISRISQNLADSFGNEKVKPMGDLNTFDWVTTMQDRFNPKAISFTLVDDNIVIDLQVVPGICSIMIAYADAVVDITFAIMSVYPVIKRAFKKYESSITSFGKFLLKKPE